MTPDLSYCRGRELEKYDKENVDGTKKQNQKTSLPIDALRHQATIYALQPALRFLQSVPFGRRLPALLPYNQAKKLFYVQYMMH